MKNILFFITAIIFITGCGSSSSSLPTLSFDEANKGNVVIFRNVSDAFLKLNKAEFIAGLKKESGLTATEFAYSSIVDCTSFGFTRINSQDVKGNSERPDVNAYASLAGGSCSEFNFLSTSFSGTSGLTLLLK